MLIVKYVADNDTQLINDRLYLVHAIYISEFRGANYLIYNGLYFCFYEIDKFQTCKLNWPSDWVIKSYKNKTIVQHVEGECMYHEIPPFTIITYQYLAENPQMVANIYNIEGNGGNQFLDFINTNSIPLNYEDIISFELDNWGVIVSSTKIEYIGSKVLISKETLIDGNNYHILISNFDNKTILFSTFASFFDINKFFEQHELEVIWSPKSKSF